MHARGAPWAQAGLSACAFTAAVAYGARWLGMSWSYDVQVSGNSFQLGPEFPLGLLAAALMGATATVARAQGRMLGATGLSLGGGAIFASSLWLLLVWAPSGAPPGQHELLRDAARLGFMLLALSMASALPRGAQPLARAGTLALGIVLAPMLLFPDHVKAAGVGDADGTLPMLLFFVQGLVVLSGAAQFHPRSRGRPKAGEAAWMRASSRRRTEPLRTAKPAVLRQEPMRAPLLEDPRRPGGPHHPGPPQARRAPWFYQF